jgi:hypothetical protein
VRVWGTSCLSPGLLSTACPVAPTDGAVVLTVRVTVPELPEPVRFEKLHDAPDGSPLQEKLMLLDEKLLTVSRAVAL